jgi:hypothetical protein
MLDGSPRNYKALGRVCCYDVAGGTGAGDSIRAYVALFRRVKQYVSRITQHTSHGLAVAHAASPRRAIVIVRNLRLYHWSQQLRFFFDAVSPLIYELH